MSNNFADSLLNAAKNARAAQETAPARSLSGQKKAFNKGSTRMRLVPFKHTVNEWDLKRRGPMALPLTQADIGQEIQLVGIPVAKVWRDDGTVAVPTFQDNDPLQLEALAKSKRGILPKNWYRLSMAVNVWLPDHPDLGVMPISLSTEWWGQKSREGMRLCYGIDHLINGYYPGPEEITVLPPITGIGLDAILGAEIVITKAEGITGGKPGLILDLRAPGGAVKLGQQNLPPLPAAITQAAVDLLQHPSFFHGNVSRGPALSREQEEFQAAFSIRAKQGGGPVKGPTFRPTGLFAGTQIVPAAAVAAAPAHDVTNTVTASSPAPAEVSVAPAGPISLDSDYMSWDKWGVPEPVVTRLVKANISCPATAMENWERLAEIRGLGPKTISVIEEAFVKGNEERLKKGDKVKWVEGAHYVGVVESFNLDTGTVLVSVRAKDQFDPLARSDIESLYGEQEFHGEVNAPAHLVTKVGS